MASKKPYKHPLASGWFQWQYVPMAGQHHSSEPVLNAAPSTPKAASGLEKSRIAKQNSVIETKDFIAKHLRSPPRTKQYRLRRNNYNRAVASIKNSRGVEATLYQPVCKLLNQISDDIYKLYHSAGTELPQDGHIRFIDHHEGPPAYGVSHFDVKPDILCVLGRDEELKSHKKRKANRYTGVPFHYVVSVGEGKIHDVVKGTRQAVTYARQLLDARPDMSGVYVFFANRDGYRIIWSDAAGHIKTPLTEWDDLLLLECYVRSLYYPPEDRHLWDLTIQSPCLLPVAGINETRTHWTIKVDDEDFKGTYANCNRIYVGEPWGRRTNVFMYQGAKAEDFVVIKDAFRDDARRFEEAMLLKDIHSRGIFPGVVRLIHSGDVLDANQTPIGTACPAIEGKVPHRTKKRLIMGSRGKQFSEAKSVLDLLMATYDGLEVHRGLVVDCQFIHRDLSTRNFFIYPEHADITTKGKSFISNPPKFIDEILDSDSPSNQEENKYECRALLIDADNSASLKPELLVGHDATQSIGEELASRTGTPRYIARSVGLGTVLSRGVCRVFSKMPTLSGEAKDRYIQAYGEDAYNEWLDGDGSFHGGQVTDCKFGSIPFTHRADHDVESLFWILVGSLILALPKGEESLPTQPFFGAWKLMENHEIVPGLGYDGRDPLLSNDQPDHWKEVLHPKLESLAPMLAKLVEQVRSEYGLLSPPPRQDHLHEAFRRILLEQIVAMIAAGEPIELTPGMSRAPDEPSTGSSSLDDNPKQKKTSKRKAGDNGDVPRPSKRSRYSSAPSDYVHGRVSYMKH